MVTEVKRTAALDTLYLVAERVQTYTFNSLPLQLGASGFWVGMDSAHYPEDRKGWCNFEEFPQWGILTHGHMGPRSRCVLQVRPQDGGARLGGNLFEVDLLRLAATEYCASPGGAHVLDPMHVLSKHRHQVPLCIDDGHHHWQ